MAVSATPSVRVISPKISVWNRIRRVFEYHELLTGMIRKELKVKYKNSALGFLWSLANPALYLVVFYIVFVKVLPSGIPVFPIYLLSGLLVWNLFSTALPAATSAVVGNASIVKKVSFPREILPLASVGAACVHFFLQSLVLLGAMALFTYKVGYSYLPLLIPALFTLILFTSALSIFLSALNVGMRDTQHFLELALLAWFWGTPVVYQFRLVADKLGPSRWMAFLNPITPIVITFQRALYNKVNFVKADGSIVKILPIHVGQMWYLEHLLIVAAASVVLLYGAISYFGRVEGNFAEEL